VIVSSRASPGFWSNIAQRTGQCPVPPTGSAHRISGRPVAVVDATGIGIGTAVLGIPPAVPPAALVFLGAFIPIIVAVVAGGVAVLIALVAAARSRRW
jgi:hypothetical protein